MDTYMTITAYGNNSDEAVSQAQKKVEELDKMLSTGDEESEIYKLNSNGSAVLSDETFYLVKKSLEFYALTNGAFNPTVFPLMDLWGFSDGNYRVPTENEIHTALQLAVPNEIVLDDNTNTVNFNKDGMKIGFGGIAKGYTSSEIMKIFEEYEIESGQVNLGGNVQLFGAKPDGNLWNVGIECPDTSADYLGKISTKDKAIITSGGYERNFTENGVTYHHIMDPETGYPANNGLISVTIISEDGTLADALSTALYVMGTEKAQKFYQDSDQNFDVILYTDDGRLIVSEGISSSFTPLIDAEVDVIEKH
jgi:thiamine biosynthesis lipoprotein